MRRMLDRQSDLAAAAHPGARSVRGEDGGLGAGNVGWLSGRSPRLTRRTVCAGRHRSPPPECPPRCSAVAQEPHRSLPAPSLQRMPPPLTDATRHPGWPRSVRRARQCLRLPAGRRRSGRPELSRPCCGRPAARSCSREPHTVGVDDFKHPLGVGLGQLLDERVQPPHAMCRDDLGGLHQVDVGRHCPAFPGRGCSLELSHSRNTPPRRWAAPPRGALYQSNLKRMAAMVVARRTACRSARSRGLVGVRRLEVGEQRRAAWWIAACAALTVSGSPSLQPPP
jgi:hypothetical protein